MSTIQLSAPTQGAPEREGRDEGLGEDDEVGACAGGGADEGDGFGGCVAGGEEDGRGVAGCHPEGCHFEDVEAEVETDGMLPSECCAE